MADPGDRDESALERLDRHWNELLQELRVSQTGVQLLAGFLLTLPFQQRFTEISEADRRLYLVAFGLAALSTCLLIAPVSAHRLLYRKGRRGSLLRVSQVLALGGLTTLGATVTVVVGLIFDVVLGAPAGWWAAAVAVGVLVAAWLVLPLVVRGRA
jgi:hypothetical protein